MIHVHTAVLAKTTSSEVAHPDARSSFCDSPRRGHAHCAQPGESLTETLRQRCNKKTWCDYNQQLTSLVECNARGDEFADGQVYIYVQYECLPGELLINNILHVCIPDS